MLSKMGWKGGSSGLGKHQQGTSTNLRAVRRAESLGIGAETDAFGDKGWEDTNRGYHGVLDKLKKEYGNGSGEGSGEEVDEETRKRRRKEEKKRKKREEKRRAAASSSSGNSSGNESNDNTTNTSTVRLAQNKVQAGHARKMREAKDINNKSAEDMAAIFGFKADFYKQSAALAVGAATGGGGGDKDRKKKSKKRSRKGGDESDGEPRKEEKKKKKSKK